MELGTTGPSVELRRTGRSWVARIRVIAISAFFLIALAAGPLAGKPQWTALVPLLTAYWMVSLVVAALARRTETAALTAWTIPLVDIAALWALQHAALAVAPSPGYVVGWSIGLFLFATLLSGFTFDSSVLWATGACSAVAQAALVVQAGLGADLIATNCTLLLFGAIVTTAGARRVESAIAALVANERARAAAEQHALAVEREREAVRSWTEHVVHDLKQPLAGAISLAELWAGEPDQPPSHDDLTLLAGELRRLEQMVSDLVILSRLEQGVLKPQFTEQPLSSLLEHIRAVHAADGRAKGISLEVDAPPGLSGRIDPVLLLRAIENLVSNALRLARPGARVRLHAAQTGDLLVVAVQNNGPPVPETARHSLFQKRTSSEAGHHHAGLGLYFCRMIAEAHGGVARLADSTDWTVDFRLELPAPVNT